MSTEGRWRIAVDLMGGDQAPQAIFEAVLQVQQAMPECAMVAITTEALLPALKKQLLSLPAMTLPNIEWVFASEVVEMHDSPLLAVRRKKDSTMAVGIELLKNKKVDAFVSTGNTGALFASAIFNLPRLPTIERPALLAVLPTGPRGMVVLDVGANVDVSAPHLVDFARLGVIYRQCAHKIAQPTVGLLNIGVEAGKGTSALKEAYQLMETGFGTYFKGNIEGRDAFQGTVDVLVTDGFAGNIFLKTCEGATAYLMDQLRTRFATVTDKTVWKLLAEMDQQYNYSEHPGAILAGVDGIVIKCHGNSDAKALINGIKGAVNLAKVDLIAKMKKKLST